MHGDFCFSNIFYDFRADTIRVVDPRGYVADGHPTIFGDIRYDIAKLYHSVIGGYDSNHLWHLLIRESNINRPANQLSRTAHLMERQADFRQRTFGGLEVSDSAAEPISILLFLSMLPLHADRPDVSVLSWPMPLDYSKSSTPNAMVIIFPMAGKSQRFKMRDTASLNMNSRSRANQFSGMP